MTEACNAFNHKLEEYMNTGMSRRDAFIKLFKEHSDIYKAMCDANRQWLELSGENERFKKWLKL